MATCASIIQARENVSVICSQHNSVTMSDKTRQAAILQHLAAAGEQDHSTVEGAI